MSLEPIVLPVLCALGTQAGAPHQMVSVPIGIEMVAIVAASISGVLTARERKLDLLGAVFLAAICSLGGGLLRDMILQVGSVYILEQPLALPVAFITAAIVFVIPSVIASQDRLIAVLDIFAVGLFAATGADKAFVYGFNPLICIVMGFFTGVGGGMLRDICLGQTPSIFQRSNFYAVAAIAGAMGYTAVVAAGLAHSVAVITCVVVTMGLRFLSLRFNIMSPTEVNLSRVLPYRHRRGRHGADGEVSERPVEVAPAIKPRLDRPDRSAAGLATRRRRTLAEIDKRRSQERRSAALDRLKRHRRAREQRKLDL